ncbi:MAG: type 1 glutamine amidotransferase [Myxococcota bacterium]
MTSPRVLLVCLRDPDDPMVAHEVSAFTTRAGLAPGQLDIHHMCDGTPSLSKADVVFFGGSGSYSVLDDVLWIRQGMDLLLHVVDRKIPAWASCFGFQGLALALGGEVNRDPERTEMGAVYLKPTPESAADPVFSVLPAGGFWAQQGHQDHVDRLPEGVTRMAEGTEIRNQAFKVDRAPFWASQFHPELTAKTTLDRFHHYSARYLSPEQQVTQLAQISRGTDSPEVGTLLRRVVATAAGT